MVFTIPAIWESTTSTDIFDPNRVLVSKAAGAVPQRGEMEELQWNLNLAVR